MTWCVCLDSHLVLLPQQSLDAQNSEANADTQLKNSQDDHRNVRGCQHTLI